MFNWQKITEIFRNLNLFWKFQFSLFLVSTVSLCFIAVFSYYQGKELLTQKSFELLTNITDHKKDAIEDHFQGLKGQILSLSLNPSTRQAFVDFKQALKAQKPIQDAEDFKTLRNFYDIDFLRQLRYNLLDPSTEGNYFPQNKIAQALKFKYIANNPNPDEYRHRLVEALPSEPYDRIHKTYHPFFKDYIDEFNLEDLLLVDNKGNVIYSVNKSVDFATNFINGPFKNSNAAYLFKRVMRSKDTVLFQDYDFYQPNYSRPSSFLAKVIYDQPDKIRPNKLGVLLFRLSTEPITEILTNNKQWEAEGLGQSGETALIGSDFLLRNNTRRSLEDLHQYYLDLLAGGEDSLKAEQIKRLRTTVLLRNAESQATIDALNGKEGSRKKVDFLGNEVFDVYKSVDILGLKWAILTEMDAEEIFREIDGFFQSLAIVCLVIFVVIIILGVLMARTFSRPLKKMQQDITMLSEGTFPEASNKNSKDELGKMESALTQLINRMKNVAEFAEDIGEGDFDHEFHAQGKDDILGIALIQMRDNLKELAIEESQRNWFDKGTSLFGQTLRNNSQGIRPLGEVVIAKLVKYLNANQGAFFIYQEREKVLKLLSAYAYDKYKYLDKSMKPGEGLVGQAFIERETIYLTEIPEDYTDISSGLGNASPSTILLVPVQTNEEIYGVIELASFEHLKPHEVNFVNVISEDIATTISTIKANEETHRLLKESRNVAQQLRRQEEAMLQNFEDLMRTQEELRKRQEQINQAFKEYPQLEEEANGELINQVNLEMDNANLNRKIKSVILRQKEILDKAVAKNQAQEVNLKTKLGHLDDENPTPPKK